MLFSSNNYKLLSIGLAMVVVGFLAMYIENEVNGIISLFISPLVIVGGYVVILFSILSKKKESSVQTGDE